MNSAMIKRNSLLAFFCACLVFSITCPSSAYTTLPADSIRVKWMEGKKFILHKVEPKETWQHLSRRYNCTVADLNAANEGVEQLKIGQIINIPSAAALVSSNAGSDSKDKDNVMSSGVVSQDPQKEKLTENLSGAGNKITPVTYKVKKIPCTVFLKNLISLSRTLKILTSLVMMCFQKGRL